MTQTLDLPFSITLPNNAPDSFSDPQVKECYELLQNALQVALQQLLTMTGTQGQDPSVWSTVLPETSLLVNNVRRFYAQAEVAIPYGRLVGFHTVGGITKARFADANVGVNIPAQAFTLSAIAAGAYGEFFLGGGLLPAVTGLVAGSNLYLAGTGQFSLTAPSLSGTTLQNVGFSPMDKYAFFNLGSFTTNP